MFHLKILNSKRFVFNSYWPIKQTKGRRNHFKGILRHDAGKRKHDTFNQKQDFKHHVSWRIIELALSGYHTENTFFFLRKKGTSSRVYYSVCNKRLLFTTLDKCHRFFLFSFLGCYSPEFSKTILNHAPTAVSLCEWLSRNKLVHTTIFPMLIFARRRCCSVPRTIYTSRSLTKSLTPVSVSSSRNLVFHFPITLPLCLSGISISSSQLSFSSSCKNEIYGGSFALVSCL